MSTLLCFAVLGCTTTPPATSSSASALNGSLTSAYQLASFDDGFEATGVSGDQRVLFTTREPTVANPAVSVLVAARLSGRQVGTLSPPPGGWGDPAHTQVISYQTSGFGTSGTLLVIDDGGLPPNAHPVIYRYAYSYDPARGFSSSLIDAHPQPAQTFPPTSIDGMGYIGGATALPGGSYALADALDGAIWTCDASLTCQLAMADPDFAPGFGGPFTGVGRAPGGGTRQYTLELPGDFLPGLLNVAYAASTDEVCGHRTTPPGGIYCVARAVLLDQSTSPFAKSKRTLVAPQVGLSDMAHGIAYDTYNPTSPWLYWARTLSDAVGGGSNVIRRVNLSTNEVQVVAESLTVYDFSTALAVLPPLVDGSPLTNLAVAMGQEENNSQLNVTLGGVDQFVAPTLLGGATVLSR